MADNHDHDRASQVDELFKRKETIRNKLEQAKGRLDEINKRIQEEEDQLTALGVTPHTAEQVLEELNNEIIVCIDTATRLVEEIENDSE